jgi:hypothetical protein
MEISRRGGSWSTIDQDVFILIGIIALLIVIVGVLAKKIKQPEA